MILCCQSSSQKFIYIIIISSYFDLQLTCQQFETSGPCILLHFLEMRSLTKNSHAYDTNVKFVNFKLCFSYQIAYVFLTNIFLQSHEALVKNNLSKKGKISLIVDESINLKPTLIRSPISLPISFIMQMTYDLIKSTAFNMVDTHVINNCWTFTKIYLCSTVTMPTVACKSTIPISTSSSTNTVSVNNDTEMVVDGEDGVNVFIAVKNYLANNEFVLSFFFSCF